MTAGATARCSLGARERGDEMLATAPPARRFFLLEVPGPWAPDVQSASGLNPTTARSLLGAAGNAGARFLLIRRPGRHPAVIDRPRHWAVVHRDRPVRWGLWTSETDLLDLDLAAQLADPPTDPAASPDPAACTHPAASADPAAPTGKPLALVCTQGRHDVCCAVEGRPVVAAAAADHRLDVWECSHVGGDRFAANLLFLPSGRLFGGLTAATTARVLAAELSDRVVLEHYRGRYGDPAITQAAQWHLMRSLGEDEPARVGVEPVGPVDGTSGTADVIAHHDNARYRLRLAWSPTEPQHLTCRATRSARARTYRMVGEPVRLSAP